MIYISFFLYYTDLSASNAMPIKENIWFCNLKFNDLIVLNKTHLIVLLDYFLCFFAKAKTTLKVTLLICFYPGHFPFLFFHQKCTSCFTRIPVSSRRILFCLIFIMQNKNKKRCVLLFIQIPENQDIPANQDIPVHITSSLELS